MSIKFEKLKPGMIVYSWGRDGTVLRNKCCWSVEIVEVLEDGVMASWNTNKAQFFSRREAERWHAKRYAPKTRGAP